MKKMLYLLPGRGNTLCDLGKSIITFDYKIFGREFKPPFSEYSFAQQIDIIQNDLQQHFWFSTSNIIGHSYGAYLLLHALCNIGSYPGRILLLSPLFGSGSVDNRIFFRPPIADKLQILVENNNFPDVRYLEIHLGENDKESNPYLALKLKELNPDFVVKILPEVGHKIPQQYVRKVLREFLMNTNVLTEYNAV